MHWLNFHGKGVFQKYKIENEIEIMVSVRVDINGFKKIGWFMQAELPVKISIVEYCDRIEMIGDVQKEGKNLIEASATFFVNWNERWIYCNALHLMNSLVKYYYL